MNSIEHLLIALERLNKAEKLLRRYMQHVVDCESVTFVEMQPPGAESPLTEEERATLLAIEKRLFKAPVEEKSSYTVKEELNGFMEAVRGIVQYWEALEDTMRIEQLTEQVEDLLARLGAVLEMKEYDMDEPKTRRRALSDVFEICEGTRDP